MLLCGFPRKDSSPFPFFLKSLKDNQVVNQHLWDIKKKTHHILSSLINCLVGKQLLVLL